MRILFLACRRLEIERMRKVEGWRLRERERGRRERERERLARSLVSLLIRALIAS